MNSQSHFSQSIYVGLDLHKDSIDIAVAQAGRDGEVPPAWLAGQRAPTADFSRC
jgi:hypothetical protein